MKDINAYVLSNIGNVRDNHEDNFFIPKEKYINQNKQKEIKTNETNIEYEYSSENGIFAVCDGMGGHKAGEVASRLAVEKIIENYDDLLKKEKNTLIDFIKKLNNYICDYSKKNPECADMGSTFSCLIIDKKDISLLHVGDSKIYKYENGILVQLSKDHTEGCRLVEAGILKKEDLDKFPHRKALYKYIGREGELIADYDSFDNDKPSRYIISSDGLSDTLNNEEISKIVAEAKTPKDVCYNLLKKCLSKGNICSDNVTIICLDTK